MKPEPIVMKPDQAASFMKANAKMLYFWGGAIVMVIAAWVLLMRKGPAPAGADEPAPAPAPAVATATPVTPLPAPVVITPITPKSNISITSTSLAKTSTAAAMDEYAYMAKLSNLQGENLAKFDRALAEREIAISAWSKGPGKQVEDVRAAMKAAKAAKDQDAVKELQSKYDLLNQMDIDYRTMLRADVMSELSLEQQRRWAGFVINGQILKKLSRIELSDRQKEFILRLCDETADRVVKQDTVEKDPFLNSLKTPEVLDPIMKQTRDKILTIEQRARIPQPGKNGGVILSR